MTLTEIALLSAAIAGVLAFILFWINPAKTSQTFALMFSTIRHIFRLKKEVKGEKVPSKRQSKEKPSFGTISSYLDPETRQQIEKMNKTDD